MKKPEPEDDRIVLIPFDPQEAISVAEAAERSAKSESTVRSWCVTHRIGRRIADGHWQVSQVALQMLLDNDKKALCAYHRGDRTSAAVVEYFNRFVVPIPPSQSNHDERAVSLNCASGMAG
jgi:hypothetical protein